MEIEEKIQKLRTQFDSCSQWEDKYKYMIGLGKQLGPLDLDLKLDKYKVQGCQSQVWLVPALSDGLLYFKADSDSSLVKGIISLLLEVYSGVEPRKILAHPPEFLAELGVTEHLSLNRTNGLGHMVRKIQTYAGLFNQLVEKGMTDVDQI